MEPVEPVHGTASDSVSIPILPSPLRSRVGQSLSAVGLRLISTPPWKLTVLNRVARAVRLLDPHSTADQLPGNMHRKPQSLAYKPIDLPSEDRCEDVAQALGRADRSVAECVG